MTKYAAFQALVNAGCNLDKLHTDVIQLIENACDKSERREPSFTDLLGTLIAPSRDTSHKNEVSLKARALRLLAEMDMELDEMSRVQNAGRRVVGAFYYSTLSRDHVAQIKDAVAKDNFKSANKLLNDWYYVKEFRKFSKYLELVEVMGSLI